MGSESTPSLRPCWEGGLAVEARRPAPASSAVADAFTRASCGLFFFQLSHACSTGGRFSSYSFCEGLWTGIWVGTYQSLPW